MKLFCNCNHDETMRQLHERIRILENSMKLELDNGYGRRPPNTIPLREVVLKIADHLGMEVDKIPATDAKWVAEFKKRGR